LSLSLDEDDEEDSLSLLLPLLSLEDYLLAWASSSAYFFSKRSFGASLRNCLRSSVRAPRPMLVKKFIEKRAF
jgi:hypothetical protein